MKKLDMSKFRKQTKVEQDKKANGGKDPRFLPYFKLGENETMKVRLLPDGGDSGSYFVEYHVHDNIRDNRIKTMMCSKNVGEYCPACSRAWELKEAGNKEESDKWRNSSKRIAQCIVIDSPIEIPENEDGSVIKLINMPFHMWDNSLEGIMNGTVDDPFDFENGNNFVIKLTKLGKNNRYDKCFWEAKTSELPEDVLEALLDDANEFHDLATLVPEGGAAEDVLAWMEAADEILATPQNENGYKKPATSTKASTPEASTDAQEEPEAAVPEEADATPKKSSKDLLAALKAKRGGTS